MHWHYNALVGPPRDVVLDGVPAPLAVELPRLRDQPLEPLGRVVLRNKLKRVVALHFVNRTDSEVFQLPQAPRGFISGEAGPAESKDGGEVSRREDWRDDNRQRRGVANDANNGAKDRRRGGTANQCCANGASCAYGCDERADDSREGGGDDRRREAAGDNKSRRAEHRKSSHCCVAPQGKLFPLFVDLVLRRLGLRRGQGAHVEPRQCALFC